MSLPARTTLVRSIFCVLETGFATTLPDSPLGSTAVIMSRVLQQCRDLQVLALIIQSVSILVVYDSVWRNTVVACDFHDHSMHVKRATILTP